MVCPGSAPKRSDKARNRTAPSARRLPLSFIGVTPNGTVGGAVIVATDSLVPWIRSDFATRVPASHTSMYEPGASLSVPNLSIWRRKCRDDPDEPPRAAVDRDLPDIRSRPVAFLSKPA
jgi:hypothetical protein